MTSLVFQHAAVRFLSIPRVGDRVCEKELSYKGKTVETPKWHAKKSMRKLSIKTRHQSNKIAFYLGKELDSHGL